MPSTNMTSLWQLWDPYLLPNINQCSTALKHRRRFKSTPMAYWYHRAVRWSRSLLKNLQKPPVLFFRVEATCYVLNDLPGPCQACCFKFPLSLYNWWPDPQPVASSLRTWSFVSYGVSRRTVPRHRQRGHSYLSSKGVFKKEPEFKTTHSRTSWSLTTSQNRAGGSKTVSLLS